MLQPGAFCEHTVQQSATAAGAPCTPDPAGGAYSAPPDLLAAFKGPLHGGEGEWEERGREEEWRRGDLREGKLGRPLAKAGRVVGSIFLAQCLLSPDNHRPTSRRTSRLSHWDAAADGPTDRATWVVVPHVAGRDR